MISKVTHTSFKMKLGFESYFSAALAKEARAEELVNRINFDGTFDCRQEMLKRNNQENYLRKLEHSLDTSPDMHLKKKLAATLERGKAYSLLQAINSMFIEDEKFVFSLNRDVDLTANEKTIILGQVKAVFNCVAISSVEFRVRRGCERVVDYVPEKLPDNVWGKMRSHWQKNIKLADIDRNWFQFSKVDAVIDEGLKTIVLKASTAFIQGWVNREYECLLENTAKMFGYEYLGISLNFNN